jgi:hypothetical protein
MNTQRNRCWSTRIPHLACKILFHDTKVGVWCTLNAWRIMGHVFQAYLINFERHKADTGRRPITFTL